MHGICSYMVYIQIYEKYAFKSMQKYAKICNDLTSMDLKRKYVKMCTEERNQPLLKKYAKNMHWQNM